MAAMAAVGGKAVLFFAVMGLGALMMYFGVLMGTTSSIGDSCHSDRAGEFTITITKYNVTGDVHCSKR